MLELCALQDGSAIVRYSIILDRNVCIQLDFTACVLYHRSIGCRIEVIGTSVISKHHCFTAMVAPKIATYDERQPASKRKGGRLHFVPDARTSLRADLYFERR